MPPSAEPMPYGDDGSLPLLREELNLVTKQMDAVIPPNAKEVFQRFIKNMADSDVLDLALKRGDDAPDFVLPDHEGNMVSSADLRKVGPLVVVFFRGTWCGYCDATLRMLRRYTPHIKSRGATIVAISPQTVERTAAVVKEAGLNFHVLSDMNSEYAQLCNIAFVLPDELKSVLTSWNVDLKEINGDDSGILPMPATYVVGRDGRVTFSYLDVDFSKRAEPLDVLNALPALSSKRQKMSLNEAIEYELAKIRDQLPDRSVREVFDEIDRLHSADVESAALKVGDRAPDFKLHDKEGELVELRKLRRKGPVVITFYHGQESPLCSLQLQAMQKYLSKMTSTGASVVAIGPDVTPDALHKAAVRSGARFPLLGDYGRKVAKEFGIAHEMTQPFQGSIDNDCKRQLPLTATYIVDRSGFIIYSFVKADHTKRAEPSRLLEVLLSNTSSTTTACSLAKGLSLSTGPASSDEGGQLRRNWKRMGPFSLLLGRRLAKPHTGSNNFRVALFGA